MRSDAIHDDRLPGAADVGLLLLRAGVGLMLAAHGAQKLFGRFGGPGLEGTAQMFGDLGYRPVGIFALVGSVAEFAGGLLLTLGLLTPLAAAMAIGVMVNGIVAVHWPVFWWTEGGLEHPLTFAVAAAAIAFTGPGRAALDYGRSWQRLGPGGALATIFVGLLAAALALIVRAL